MIDSVENDKIASWYNDTPAIVLAIQRQPGTNTIEVVDVDQEASPNPARPAFPPRSASHLLYDRSVSIRESVQDVKFTLLLAVCLVVLVIFLFLRNLSATLIPSLALPISIVGTFAVMYLLGYSLDNLSLMALTLSVGFVVDDAIVMLENIVRHMEHGEPPLEAALNGSREIGFTIVSMTLSLVVVFIPVLFMGGILGRLLHEFAVTISMAILISGFVSLTLTPMLCSRFLRPPETLSHGRLYGIAERVFIGMQKAYEWSLQRVLKHPLATLLFSGLIFVFTIYLFFFIPKGFLPSEDTGQIFAFTEAAQGISLRIHGSAPEKRGRGHPPGPQRGFLHVRRRGQRDQRGFQHRPSLHPPEGPEGAEVECGRDHPALAPEAGRHSRHPGLHAESSPHPHRRGPDQEPVPVYPAEPGHQ